MSNKTTRALDDDQLDALLDADEAAHGDNELAIFARIHERRRKRAHARAKATQPELGLLAHDQQILGDLHQEVDICPCGDCLLAKLSAFFHAPLTPQDLENGPGSVDYLLQTIDDCFKTGSAEDAIFAAFRLARKVWGFNSAHLGPIEGFPQAEQSK